MDVEWGRQPAFRSSTDEILKTAAEIYKIGPWKEFKYKKRPHVKNIAEDIRDY